MYDCVIIGGGPAGLTAATYLGRFLRFALVIDAEPGRFFVDEHQQTTISGMFAASDMVEGLDQIAVAAG